MTVPLDDEQLTAISVHRKLRDVVPRRDGQAVNRPAQPTLLEIDPQIRKAVEFLEQPNAPAEL
jgi:hypothetical protein